MHYNPESDIIVASDASFHGIGACMLHKMPDGSKKPIAHASRSLLPSEKHNSKMEKEVLVIIFAVTKFYRYLHGRFFKLQTDHKPLRTIFGSKKGLPVYTANRLLRWGTILLNYNFKFKYLPSRQIGHADGLSRLIPSQSEPLEDSVIASLRTDSEIKNMMLNTIRELLVTLQDIKREALEDEFISATKQKIADKNQQIADIFSLCDNVLLYGERVVIPKTLQKRILKDFHADHQGKNRMKSLMRSYVYWPKMDLDISNMVDVCKGCALAVKAPPITYKPWPKTDQRWSRIHVDFAGPMEDIYYLIVVDSYTKWPEVLRCKRPTTGVTITFLHELFARFGVVDCLVSDNGTQFTSSDFKEFCNTFQIKHNYTSVPPKIQQTGGTFRRHSEESSKESLWNHLPRKGFTTVLTGLPNHTESEYTRRNITCRDYVCAKDTTSF